MLALALRIRSCNVACMQALPRIGPLGVAAAFALVLALAALAAPGDLDSTFGTNGRVVSPGVSSFATASSTAGRQDPSGRGRRSGTRRSSTAITRAAARCSRSAGRSSTWRRRRARKDRRRRGRERAAAGARGGAATGRGGRRTAKKKTRPPKRFTEGTLLTAMETAGATLDEKELSDAMKESGLGTPATRAAIIEVLFKREYARRNGKSLEATDKGIRLIEVVHPEVKSPAMTGQWEAYLRRIHRGTAQLGGFHEGHRGLRARGGREGEGVAREPRAPRRAMVGECGGARAAAPRRRRLP